MVLLELFQRAAQVVVVKLLPTSRAPAEPSSLTPASDALGTADGSAAPKLTRQRSTGCGQLAGPKQSGAKDGPAKCMMLFVLTLDSATAKADACARNAESVTRSTLWMVAGSASRGLSLLVDVWFGIFGMSGKKLMVSPGFVASSIEKNPCGSPGTTCGLSTRQLLPLQL